MVPFNFRAPCEMLDALTNLAAELGVLKSDLYRGALAEYLKRAEVDWEGKPLPKK